jgi:hypothetical protein
MPDQSATPRPLPGSKTVLVVDDVSDVRRGATRVLSEEGYRVFEAESADEALAALRAARFPVDLVIAPVRMPDVSGAQLARQILEEWPGVRVIFSSGDEPDVREREGQQFTESRFLVTPYTREELVQTVHEALRD